MKHTQRCLMKSIVLRSFARPYHFSLWKPTAYNARFKNLEITSAVNTDTRIEIIKVYANPLTVPEPSHISTRAAINVVTLPSTIAESAFLYPSLIEVRTDFPLAISSRIREIMITFASTAIPIPRITPAIPGNVNVISNR